jgi:hypothetical protein
MDVEKYSKIRGALETWSGGQASKSRYKFAEPQAQLQSTFYSDLSYYHPLFFCVPRYCKSLSLSVLAAVSLRCQPSLSASTPLVLLSFRPPTQVFNPLPLQSELLPLFQLLP